MSTPSEAIRKLLLAHFDRDEEAFRNAAREFVDRERSLNHHILVKDLEKILAKACDKQVHPKAIYPTLNGINGNLPRDKERNAVLIEFIEPRRELSQLILSPSVRQSLERIVTERRKSELLGAHGLRPISKVLFCGPPGCGKTVAAEAIARELYFPLATVRFDAVVSSYLGETAANLRKVFEFGKSRPLVLFFDEFDAIGKQRTATDEHGELKRVVNSFLQLLDGFKCDTLTIAATNHQGLLDPALWRRFDDIILFSKPEQDEIEALLCRQLRQISVIPSLRLSEVAQKLYGLAHADIERVTQEAIKQTILSGRTQVEEDSLLAAVDRQIKRVTITEPRPADDG